MAGQDADVHALMAGQDVDDESTWASCLAPVELVVSKPFPDAEEWHVLAPGQHVVTHPVCCKCRECELERMQEVAAAEARLRAELHGWVELETEDPHSRIIVPVFRVRFFLRDGGEDGLD